MAGVSREKFTSPNGAGRQGGGRAGQRRSASGVVGIVLSEAPEAIAAVRHTQMCPVRMPAETCWGVRGDLVNSWRWRWRRLNPNKKEQSQMSKQEEGGLILKLYELRREETMRKARDWYFRDFNPQSMADVNAAMFGEHSGHLRMVVSYWDMAAVLNNGAISLELFNDSNGEHIGVFSKIEPLLGEIRAAFAPQFVANLEKLIDATPDGRKRAAAAREQIKAIRAQLAGRQAAAAQN